MTFALTPRIALDRPHPRRLARARAPVPALALVFTLAMVASQGASAEANPYYIGVSQSFTHDSNLFRVQSSQNSSSETISGTGIVGGIDQPIGRQRLRVNGTLQSNRFSSNSNLNNTGYGLNAALDWSTIERLSGTVSYSANQHLANYGTPNTAQITSRNIQKTQEFSSQAVLGGVTRLSFFGGFTHRSVDYSAPEYDAQQFEQNAANIGVRYRLSGALDVGSALRMTRGRYAHFRPLVGGGFEADTLKRSDLDLTANWTPSGLTTVAGRVSLGRQTHSVTGLRDFSGVTGSIALNHNPGGKLRYSAVLSRDTGAESSFLTLTDISGAQVFAVTDNSRLSTTAQLSVGYEATAKIRLNATLRASRRSLVDTLTISNGGTSSGTTGTDTVTGINFGASYVPLRNLYLTCNIGHDKRTTTSALSSAYSSNTAFCSAKYTLQ